MSSYRTNVPQPVNPLEFLYKLERDLARSETQSTAMIEDLSSRLELLETRVSAISERFDNSNRQLEKDVVELAARLQSLEEDAV
jgi:chaperonin cofactor prefoldin